MPPSGAPPGPPRGWLRAENPWPWLLLILVAVAALLIWLFLFRGHGNRATVPRVLGLSQQAAITRLNDKGFNVTAVRRPARGPANQVVSQNPGAGSQLKKGQKVIIAVSSGPPPVTTTTTTRATTTSPQPRSATMPDATGKALSVAGAAVEGVGLIPDTYPVASSEPSGTVISQDPVAGTAVEQGRNVRLNVSTGKGNQPPVGVPDVKGEKTAEALAKIWTAKLTARTLYQASPQKGVVLQEQPGSGGQAAAFTQITLYVGR